ncbi:DUF255 domain-containing protein [Dehalococcoidia bacterium]|nr:DUF255 domain-containing protein [Dehalococcoidia bacterium]
MTQNQNATNQDRPHKMMWRSWGTDAFNEAEKQDKPILLMLTATWCHWCHTMDSTTYDDDTVANYLNEHFIPIRVDSDRRPDINERYNMGGWPSTAFLTPSGDTLTGATYIAPEDMQHVMQQVRDVYTQRRDYVNQQVAHVRSQAEAQQPILLLGAKPNLSVVSTVTENILKIFEPEFGGFGKMPKFPAPDVIDFLLYQQRFEKDANRIKIVEKTLGSMSTSDIFDQIEGGMFRYSNGIDWTDPQTEKVLEVNAANAKNYLHAYQVTNNTEYLDIADNLLSFIEQKFLQKEGLYFAASQAADQEYFSLDTTKRNATNPPPIDPTVLLDASAQTISTFLYASWLLDNKHYEVLALKCLDFLWEEMWDQTQGAYHYWDKTAHVTGLLQDNAQLCRALLDAFQITGQKAYLNHALDVATVIENQFHSADGTGYYDLAEENENLGYLRYRRQPLAENAIVADALITLTHLTENGSVSPSTAEQTLGSFLQQYDKIGHFAANYANAVGRLLNTTLKYHIVGDPDEDKTQELIKQCLLENYPYKIIRTLSPTDDISVVEKFGYKPDESPVLYIRIDDTFSAPITQTDNIHATSIEMLRSSPI